MLTLAADSSYSGATVVNGGTLALGSGSGDRAGSTLPNSTVTVNAGGMLYLAKAGQFGWNNTAAIALNGGTLGMSNGQFNYIKNISMSNGAPWARGA
jgi:autotransporter-associated beta strand protein